MHSPRGSNNRLNERSANRDNANRLFDSQVSVKAKLYSATIIFPFFQNNNRGGYNAGDQDTGAFNNEEQIYYMVRRRVYLLYD